MDSIASSSRPPGTSRSSRGAREELATRWWRHYAATLGPLVVAEHARQRAQRPKRRGRPRKTVVTGFLIIDDSTHGKPNGKPNGKKLEGLGHHYSSTEHTVVKGHSLFGSIYGLLGRRCPLARKRYRQRTVCAREQVPFKSKGDLAGETVQDFTPVPGTHTHVLVDSWYTSRRLWRTVRRRQWAITAGLKANRKLRVEDPEQGRGYRPASAYAATLTAEAYQRVAWPHADGTPRTVYAHLVKTFVRKLGPCQVLVVRERLDQPLAEGRYWATSELDGDLPTVVGWAAQRWTVAQFFADVKEVFGTDQYQLRSATGLVRLWHLAFLGYAYLEEQRAALIAAGADPGLTIGQPRWQQQRRHRRLFLEWVHERFQAGLTPEQVDLLVAA